MKFKARDLTGVTTNGTTTAVMGYETNSLGVRVADLGRRVRCPVLAVPLFALEGNPVENKFIHRLIVRITST